MAHFIQFTYFPGDGSSTARKMALDECPAIPRPGEIVRVTYATNEHITGMVKQVQHMVSDDAEHGIIVSIGPLPKS